VGGDRFAVRLLLASIVAWGVAVALVWVLAGLLG
jgi:hypothetical protein